MQIFAKRTKKKAAPAGPRTVHKSDPVVEELLKKDPSEWNAKERRMVKRYQQRKEKESSNNPMTPDVEKVEPKIVEESKPDAADEKEQEKDSIDDSSSSSEDEIDSKKKDESDSDSSSDSDSDDEEEANGQQSATETEEKPITLDAAEDKPSEDDGKVPKDHEIWSVLDKLNSKQKRTLSRKLDRLGKAALEEVEEEANNILDQTMPIAVEPAAADTKRPSTDSATNTSEEPKKKRRKKAVDWSSLTPEERLRREDQRRKQQEAAERRARGEDIKPGHKRPLNSARRRANRRKPKWEKKAPADRPDIGNYKQEHHSSGFMHRKNRKQNQQQASSGW